MAVGTLLIVFLFQLFGASMRAWRQGEDQVETYREARAALQMMVRDLSQTIQPMTRGVYTSPTPTPGASPTVMAPALVIDNYPNPDPPKQSGDEINEEVYCLTTISNNGASSLCAVGYFCMWKPDLYTDSTQIVRAPQAYSLMRQYLGSGAPASGSTGAIPGLYDRFQQYSGAMALTFDNVYARFRPPQTSTTSPPQATATELASYIWDLQIRTPDTLQSTTATNNYSATSLPSVLPPYVEIRFKALSESAARQLEGNTTVNRQTWNDANDTTSSIYQKIILPGTRQFSARAPIYSGNATPMPTP